MTSIIDLRDDMIYEILPFFEINVKIGIFENAIWLKESASSQRWSPQRLLSKNYVTKKAPQPSKCQASANQQGLPIYPSGTLNAGNGIDLLFE